MTRLEKIKNSGAATIAREIKPLYCANCEKYVHMQCPDWNRDNACWAEILDWLTREVRE